MTVKHAFTSEIADGGDATLVRPSNWNAEHVETGLEHSDRVIAADDTLAANQSAVVVGGLSINDGITLFIGNNSVVGLI